MARRYATIKWTESQVTRLERAVNAYNEAIEKARPRYKGGLALLLPRTTTVADEIDHRPRKADGDDDEDDNAGYIHFPISFRAMAI